MAKKSTPKTKDIAAALGRFEDDWVIRLLKSGNQRRPGTAAYKRFELYKNGMKIVDYVKAGGSRGNVRVDVKRGNIAVEKAKAAKS